MKRLFPLLAALFPLVVCDAEPRVSKNVSVAEASRLIEEEPELVILDIRTPGEFSVGHIAGAVLIDYTSKDFEEKIRALDRDKPYLLHCQSGGRSGLSMPLFEKLEFARVYHLKAGFKGWKDAGLPVKK